ncbi:MAG: hypothetical protein NXI00_09205 [Cytophagales bacterium]|nr:hypothetical protein [Cytophagales bacterium]
MSNENFDKKIRDKLVNHIPKYDAGAWEKFNQLLPKPWYVKFFQGPAGWIIGGVTSTALVFSIITYQNQKELLNGEISTLKEQISKVQKLNRELSLKPASNDTVHITKEVNKYIRVADPASQINLAYEQGKKEGYKAALSTLNEESENSSELNGSKTVIPSPSEKSVVKNQGSTGTNTEVLRTNSTGSDKNEEVISGRESIVVEQNRKALVQGESGGRTVAEVERNALPDRTNQEEVANEQTSRNELNQKDLSTSGGELDESQVKELSEEKQELQSEEPVNQNQETLVAETEEDASRTDPEKQRKKVKFPKMRVGLTSDYLSFKVLANGPAAEVFLMDKLSFNTGLLFSGQIETEHPFAKDFNRYTGKQFNKEFEKYVVERADLIEDISIKTSFIKLPIFLNYYINTWSRFNFIISAGTKLDLSVYQDVGYLSGPLGQQINSRFEARPEPKVFNNFFYGMGLQYQQGSFVGQLTPYFDFRFRQADYFTPNKNFGINASLKFEFGN